MHRPQAYCEVIWCAPPPSFDQGCGHETASCVAQSLVTVVAKRTQRLHWSVGLSHERSDIAGAESFHSLEGNMCCTVMRGTVTLPGSKATSRAKGLHRKLGEWARMTKLADDWLPKPTILHPWPSDRFAVTHPRWKPYAGKPPVRLCAGGVR